MKVAIICYDLKRANPYDNIFVKAALIKFFNTLGSTTGDNLQGQFPEWVRFTFPDTTFLALVPEYITSGDLMESILQLIDSVGAVADKLYVAFIDSNTDMLYQAP